MSSYSRRDYPYRDSRDHEDRDSERSQRRRYDSYHPSDPPARGRSPDRAQPSRQTSSSYSPVAQSPAYATTHISSHAPVLGVDTSNKARPEPFRVSGADQDSTSNLASRIVRNLRSAEVCKAQQRYDKCIAQYKWATAEKHPDHPSIAKQARIACEDARNNLKKIQDDTADLAACFTEILKATGTAEQSNTTSDVAQGSNLGGRLEAIAREQEARLKQLDAAQKANFDGRLEALAREQEARLKQLDTAQKANFDGRLEAIAREQEARLKQLDAAQNSNLDGRLEAIAREQEARLKQLDAAQNSNLDGRLEAIAREQEARLKQLDAAQKSNLDGRLEAIAREQEARLKQLDTAQKLNLDGRLEAIAREQEAKLKKLDTAQKSNLDGRLEAIAREQEAKLKKLDTAQKSNLDGCLKVIAREQEAKLKKLESDLKASFDQSLKDSAKKLRENYDRVLELKTQEIKVHYQELLGENDKRIRERYDHELKTHASDISALRSQFNELQEAIDLDKSKQEEAAKNTAKDRDAAQEALNSLTARLVAASAKHDHLKHKVETLEVHSVSKLAKEQESFKQELGDLKTKIGDSTKEREHINHRVKAIENRPSPRSEQDTAAMTKLSEQQLQLIETHDALARKVEGAIHANKTLRDRTQELDGCLRLPLKPDTTAPVILELNDKLRDLEERLSVVGTTRLIDTASQLDIGTGDLHKSPSVLGQSSVSQGTAVEYAGPTTDSLYSELDKMRYAAEQIRMDLYALKKNAVEIFNLHNLVPVHLKDWARSANPRQNTPRPRAQAASDADKSLVTQERVDQQPSRGMTLAEKRKMSELDDELDSHKRDLETARMHLEEIYKDKESFVYDVMSRLDQYIIQRLEAHGQGQAAEIAQLRQDLVIRGDWATSQKADLDACWNAVGNLTARIDGTSHRFANDLQVLRSLHDKLAGYCKDVHEDLDMRCRNLDHWQQNFETTALVKQMTDYIKALMPGEINLMRHKLAAVEKELAMIRDPVAKKRKVSLANGGTQAVPMAPVQPS